MANSAADICNLALLQIGINRTIDDLLDPTEEARACSVLYEQSRDALLQTRPWPFATKRATLALIDDYEGLGRQPSWQYAYALPADCLLARGIWSGVRLPRRAQELEFGLEGDATRGRILLCNVEATATEPVELEYTYRVEMESFLPPLFVDALASLLASRLVMPLAVEKHLAVAARQEFEFAMQRACSVLLTERHDHEVESALLAARR